MTPAIVVLSVMDMLTHIGEYRSDTFEHMINDPWGIQSSDDIEREQFENCGAPMCA